MQSPRQVGAVALNRPARESKASPSRPVRKQLDHSIHFHGRFGATYFITICCRSRGVNQLCKPDAAQLLFETARLYHKTEQWYSKLLLLMPDHLHMLVGISGDANLSKLIRDLLDRERVVSQRQLFGADDKSQRSA